MNDLRSGVASWNAKAGNLLGKTSHGLDLALDPCTEDCGHSSMQNRGARFCDWKCLSTQFGIYAPTSSLDGLRCVLAVSVVEDLNLLTADVSVAFMNAPVEQDACDLVLLPPNMTIGGLRVIVLLYKAMNGLRRAPHCTQLCFRTTQCGTLLFS